MRESVVRLLLSVMLAIGLSPSALAAPVTLQRGEADKQGALLFTVSCEGGGGTLVQCRRDDQHCGYDSDQPLALVAELACERLGPLLQPSPQPSTEALPQGNAQRPSPPAR